MRITKVQEDDNYDIKAVMLDDGSTHGIEEAISMAKSNQIEGVNVGKDKLGRDTLRSNPDDDTSNNLSNLPRF